MSKLAQLSHVQRVKLIYKAILRVHRGLPEIMQELGDGYVKAEFRRHANASPEHTALFMKEWTSYYVTLANQVGRDGKFRPIGQRLDSQSLNNLTDEQILQLHELYKEIKLPTDGNT